MDHVRVTKAGMPPCTVASGRSPVIATVDPPRPWRESHRDFGRLRPTGPPPLAGSSRTCPGRGSGDGTTIVAASCPRSALGGAGGEGTLYRALGPICGKKKGPQTVIGP